MLESFDQSEELQMFREAVRKMSEKEFAPIAAQIDDEDAMPDKVMPLLRDMGVNGGAILGHGSDGIVLSRAA